MSSKIFDPQYWNLETLFKQIYNVPVYQRPYSWDKEQVDVLLEDLFTAYKDDKSSGYYVGNIIVHDKNEKINGNILKFEIIDGQQRITTFALMLLALYCESLSRGYPESDKTVQSIKGALWKYIDRKYVKEYRTVNLNSIEKESFKNLYDHCFSAAEQGFDIINYCENYSFKNKFEERVFGNFRTILDYISDVVCAASNDEVLNFADYLLQRAEFIAIESTCKENKVFSMFESINSKGKKLDEIDLIKTYIFSNLDPESYETYLQIWGDLIIQTHDNLYDYLYNFIKAYMCFYRQNISIVNFKTICKRELLNFYKEYDLSKALKCFLNDLKGKVRFYNMLSSAEEVHNLIKSDKLRYYFKVFTEIGYKHPKPLFLRTLIEYSCGKISRRDAIDIFVETTKFMLKALTISGRDSKDVITMFSGVMNDIYENGVTTKKIVNYAIVRELLRQGLNADKLKADLKSIDAYEQNKKLTIALLSLYDSTQKDASGKPKISFDQAYLIMSNYSAAFSLDHLLVQSPKETAPEFKYYKDTAHNTLVLKPGHDFPKEIVAAGMDYDMFTKLILNRIGNLRIYYKDKNSSRHNTAVSLTKYTNFYNYSNIVQRENDIANLLIDEVLVMPKVDLSKLQSNSVKRADDALPKMDELIQAGSINIGDKLYITVKPNGSEAILLDSKYVSFNGKKMTMNDWGCKVTGWKSIRIYTYVARVGEIDTLHQKRLAFARDHNEEGTSE